MTFQDIIRTLEDYWRGQGCLIEQPFEVEVGAGTMHPASFLRALGPEPWRVAYVQPSRRPADSRYGENPYRLYRHFQYQVVMKPSPTHMLEMYLESLQALGFDPRRHDVRFIEDDWSSPELGAAGVGWQVWLDGLEITQITYLQFAGDVELSPVSIEVTYGLERLAMVIQQVRHYQDIRWNEQFTYGQLYKASEEAWGQYNFTRADTEMLHRHFADYEQEAGGLLELSDMLPAYEITLKCSQTMHQLDARGALSLTQRSHYRDRVRELARRCAQGYLARRAELGFPLMGDES